MPATGFRDSLDKVPQATLSFGLIEIAATALGETGGDAVSMSMHPGCLVGTGIFALILLTAIVLCRQRAARTAH